MTALAAAWTPEGFVIGADGRRLQAHSKAIASDSVQKILPAQCENVYAACGIAGAGGFTTPNGINFSTFEEVKKVIGALAKRKFDSLHAYSWEIAQHLFARIFEQSSNTIPSEQMPNSTFVSLLFVGYMGSTAALAQIIIPHHNRSVSPPEWEKYWTGQSREFAIPTGSLSVCNDLRRDGQVCPPDTLNEAVDWVHFYISECIRHNNDYEDCAGIGGHIHLAIATPTGFEWAISPSQSE